MIKLNSGLVTFFSSTREGEEGGKKHVGDQKQKLKEHISINFNQVSLGLPDQRGGEDV